MNATKNLILANALVLLVGGLGTAEAAETSPALKTMKPMAGISFDLGAKHAVSYFLSVKGTCKLSLMVADAFDGSEVPSLTTTRFDVGIDGGKSARLEVAEGKSLEFTCQPGANAMSVKTLDQVAAYPPRSN